MTYSRDLPEAIVRRIRTQFTAEFATVSAAGVPIDSPLLIFPSEDLKTLDLATGLAYPTKAERARRNPKVGLLLEAGPGQPVISVSGMAAVRDADLQANMDRYLAEGILIPFMTPSAVDYQSITRHAVWYFTRIIMSVTPAHIRWWKDPSAMDEKPQEWRAPAGTVYPKSDPAPAGKPSEAPTWPQQTWRELAEAALARKAPGHLTLLDADGFPLPIGARNLKIVEEGFHMVIPKGAPWSNGTATLSFEGRETFVGKASLERDGTLLRVERALPVLPLVADYTQVLQPKPETKTKLMARLEYEAKRRGQPIPKMPAQPPEPTAGATLRMEAAIAQAAAAGTHAN
jgi:hypothetical protein